jgi:poly-gamma-glutamate synthesis protein (capsule biosynthesis protein)
MNVGGVKVAQLSYTLSFNDIKRSAPWTANLIDAGAILAEARRAREAGAGIVIVSMQWGDEYQNEPNADQLDLAPELLASPDVDLIVGHHVHVVQPIEKIGNKWVAYGIGNLTARFPDGSLEKTRDSVLPEFTFTKSGGRWEVSRVRVFAAFMEYRPEARVVNLAAATADAAVPADRRAAYTRIQERITGYVKMRGAVEAGLRIAR